MLRIEKYQTKLIVFILYLDIFRTKFISFFYTTVATTKHILGNFESKAQYWKGAIDRRVKETKYREASYLFHFPYMV
jgi:hypothetical protein